MVRRLGFVILRLPSSYEIFTLVRQGFASALDGGYVHDVLSCAAGGVFCGLRVCEQEAG